MLSNKRVSRRNPNANSKLAPLQFRLSLSQNPLKNAKTIELGHVMFTQIFQKRDDIGEILRRGGGYRECAALFSDLVER